MGRRQVRVPLLLQLNFILDVILELSWRYLRLDLRVILQRPVTPMLILISGGSLRTSATNASGPMQIDSGNLGGAVPSSSTSTRSRKDGQTVRGVTASDKLRKLAREYQNSSADANILQSPEPEIRGSKWLNPEWLQTLVLTRSILTQVLATL